jgi:hypothetical protein
MQEIPSRSNEYGDMILEIDKLIRSDRSSLMSSGPAYSSACNSHSDCYKQVCPEQNIRPAPGQLASSKKPSPALWDMCPPTNPESNSWQDSPNQPGQDLRQVRLFKTRFCSYGMECPYLAKGKCLYAHSKEEIRLRPPPPSITSKGILQRPSNGSMSPREFLPEPSHVGANSVWSIPEPSGNSNHVELASLLEYLGESEALSASPFSNLHHSHSKSTVASSSKSSLFGNISSSDTTY